MIKIIVNNVWSRISGFNDVEIVDSLDKIMSFYVEGYQFTKAFVNGWYDKKEDKFKHWDGKRHLLTNKMVFPTGLLHRVKKFCKLYNLEYEVVDQRPEIKFGEEIPIKNFIPRDYQTEIVDAVLKNGTGMIRSATGSGKTLVAAMIVAKFNIPTNIYVIGKDLLYQFHKYMEKTLGMEVGIIGDGHCEIRKFNVCSIWTAITSFGLKQKISLDDEDWAPETFSVSNDQKIKIKNLIENTNLSIFDEAHYLATDTIQSIYKISKKCKYFIGLSGTLWRDDGADLLLESVCGPKIYDIGASKLIDKGYLVPAKITFLNVPKINNLSNNYQSIYSKYIVKNDVRNKMIVDSARHLININRSVLILVRYISHGNAIAKMMSDIPLFFVNGDLGGEERQEVKKSFEAGELKCLIASSVFDIGVDIPKLDALILAGGGKSTVRALQRIGRVIRGFEGKKDAIVVDFIDNAKYLIKHSGIRISVYETEPKFIIKFPKGFDSTKIKRYEKIKDRVK